MPSAEGGHYLRKVSFNASNLRLFRSSPLSLPFVRLPCGLKAVRNAPTAIKRSVPLGFNALIIVSSTSGKLKLGTLPEEPPKGNWAPLKIPLTAA
ncbi:MAG: hypothetical protein ACTS4Z_01305 [Candidatus Hodgkinia cicadicola]